DVGGVAGILRRHIRDGAELREIELPAVDPDAQHEVFVFELVRLEDRGPTAIDAGFALRVQAQPAEPAAQVLRVDAPEAALRVHVLDAQPRIETVVVTLHALVRVQRLAVSERPLPFAARPLDAAAIRTTTSCPRIAGVARLISVP